ncbi:ATP-dependent RNA helicase [Ferrimonas sediminicola]|uniref:ATP-dependent RNA helicase n=1 Tax=Ferrimonas sediminicola TaxID=2569538 RepID=A0A4U1BD06_9GAMM|nr:helicase-related protein [Ferrimonas sediminicola]TKB48436.1 ATP-dependent RNA helicase [Ferrimonas sediminicola]
MFQTLPIDPLKPRFLKLLDHRHLVVESQTGSGKSTRLPLWAAETGRVLVVEPRRVACLALSDYLSSQGGPGVGHAIRFESTVDDTTRVAFVTPGVALRWLSDDGLAGYDTVIIDEFHERRWDTDLLLALLKRRNQHRLVLTSATIDGERLARYLEGERLSADGRQFQVSIHHLARESRQLPDERGLEGRVKEAVVRGLEESPGDVLVFLPGKREIIHCAAQLKEIDVQTVPLHGGASNTEQRAALRSGEHRRVILATNVAETSLTIPGITCVVDSGLERRTHQRNGRTVLGLHRISLASAAQRAGRAGRVQAGICYRLWGQHAPMEALTPPELKREELVEPMLAAACAGERLDELEFVDSLPEKSLGIARDKLLQMRAIDEQGRATDHGRRLYPLPIDTQFAHLITAMEEKGCREAMVDLSAALSLGARLWQPPGGEAGIKALKAWQPLECDAMTLLSLLREPLPEELSCDRQMLAEAKMLANQIRAALELPQLSVATPVSRTAWLAAVMGAQPDLVYVRRLKRPQALGNGFAEVQQGRDSRLSEQALGAVVFDQFSLPGRGVKQTLNLATCMAPVTFKQILDAGLGELQTGELQEDGHTLISRVVYAGRELGEVSHLGSGEQVVATLVREILAGQRLPGVGLRLEQDLAAWALWCALGEGEGEVPGPDAWLSRRLTELGVESFEDMELIEAQELAFDGIPDWQREEFDERFPLQLTLAELKVTVEYDIRRKSIDVVYQSGTRKGGPKRWELPRWSGWRVFYRKASKRVTLS